MRKIFIHNQEIEYKLRRSKRAKRMRLAVYCDSSVVVTLPLSVNENIVERFIREKSSWLMDKISIFKSGNQLLLRKTDKADYLKNKDAALKFAEERVAEFNRGYKFKFNKISIKDQKTRWGSCSRKGNLNYNYKLLLLPGHIADYIIVHELCHLKEFNHGKKFWSLVAKAVPDYLDIKKELKNGLK